MTPTYLIGYDWLAELRLWCGVHVPADADPGEPAEVRRWSISSSRVPNLVKCQLREEYDGKRWVMSQAQDTVEEAVYLALRQWAYADTETRAASRTA